MTHLVVIVRDPDGRGGAADAGGARPKGEVALAGFEIQASGPRTAAAQALVEDLRARGERGPSEPEVVGDVAGVLVDCGRWSARPPGGVLDVFAYREPLWSALLLVICVAVHPAVDRLGPSAN